MVVPQTRAQRRSAFTLVELLVVISIIGVLMALLLPAVNAARATMWKAECANNIKQLTTAMTNWTAAKQMRLPGYAEPVGTIPVGANLTIPKRMPWPVALMPYMEQQQLYDRFREATLAQAIAASGSGGTLIPSFICAADGEKGSGTGAQMSYVANVGMYVANRDPTVTPQPAYRANGVFQNAEEKRTAPGNAGIILPSITLKLSGVTDGAAQTVAFSENIQAVTYGLPAAYDPATLADEERFRLAAGFQWYPLTTVPAATDPRPINHPTVAGPTNFKNPMLATDPDMSPSTSPPFPGQEFARPSSFHAGGVNMGFVDGHVQFIPASISYTVYMQLMTPDGMKSNMPVISGNPTGDDPIPWQDIN